MAIQQFSVLYIGGKLGSVGIPLVLSPTLTGSIKTDISMNLVNEAEEIPVKINKITSKNEKELYFKSYIEYNLSFKVSLREKGGKFLTTILSVAQLLANYESIPAFITNNSGGVSSVVGGLTAIADKIKKNGFFVSYFDTSGRFTFVDYYLTNFSLEENLDENMLTLKITTSNQMRTNSAEEEVKKSGIIFGA